MTCCCCGAVSFRSSHLHTIRICISRVYFLSSLSYIYIGSQALLYSASTAPLVATGPSKGLFLPLELFLPSVRGTGPQPRPVLEPQTIILNREGFAACSPFPVCTTINCAAKHTYILVLMCPTAIMPRATYIRTTLTRFNHNDNHRATASSSRAILCIIYSIHSTN